MASLGGDEKVKEGKALKILTPNKVLTRLSVLLAQIKNYNQHIQNKKQKHTNTTYFALA